MAATAARHVRHLLGAGTGPGPDLGGGALRGSRGGGRWPHRSPARRFRLRPGARGRDGDRPGEAEGASPARARHPPVPAPRADGAPGGPAAAAHGRGCGDPGGRRYRPPRPCGGRGDPGLPASADHGPAPGRGALAVVAASPAGAADRCADRGRRRRAVPAGAALAAARGTPARAPAPGAERRGTGGRSGHPVPGPAVPALGRGRRARRQGGAPGRRGAPGPGPGQPGRPPRRGAVAIRLAGGVHRPVRGRGGDGRGPGRPRLAGAGPCLRPELHGAHRSPGHPLALP